MSNEINVCPRDDNDSTTTHVSAGPTGSPSSSGPYTTNPSIRPTMEHTFDPSSDPSSGSAIARSSTKISDSPSVCFAGSEIVHLEAGGTKLTAEMVVGDRILSPDGSCKLVYSEVTAVQYGKNDIKSQFVRIVSESGQDVMMTELHLILAEICPDSVNKNLNTTNTHDVPGPVQ
jgi:Hint module